jgi:hypothetical protein
LCSLRSFWRGDSNQHSPVAGGGRHAPVIGPARLWLLWKRY